MIIINIIKIIIIFNAFHRNVILVSYIIFISPVSIDLHLAARVVHNFLRRCIDDYNSADSDAAIVHDDVRSIVYFFRALTARDKLPALEGSPSRQAVAIRALEILLILAKLANDTRTVDRIADIGRSNKGTTLVTSDIFRDAFLANDVPTFIEIFELSSVDKYLATIITFTGTVIAKA